MELNAPPLLAVVGNVGLFMHDAPDTMADIIAQDTVAMRLGKGLNGMPYISDMVTGNRLLDSRLQAIERYLA